jgi:serine/threonine-protein kinase
LGRHWVTRRTGFDKAIEYFEQAVERDSAFALAYVGLADSYLLGVWYEGWGQAEAVPKARSAALKALALNNTLGEGYTTLGAIDFWLELKWGEAKENYEQAMAFSPGYAEAHQWYGQLLNVMGNREMALQQVKLALELDPMSPRINDAYGGLLLQWGRNDEAIQQYRRALELAPDYAGGHVGLGMAYLEMGMYEEALEEFQPWSSYMAAAYSALGMTDSASIVLEEAEQKGLLSQVRAQVGMGRIDDAFEIIFQMVEQRDPLLLNIMAYIPYYSTLYADPRFNEVRKKLGLPER